MKLNCPKRPDLENIIKESIEQFNRLTPRDQIALRRAQRRSWVIGEMMMDRPDSEREKIEALVDRHLAEK